MLPTPVLTTTAPIGTVGPVSVSGIARYVQPGDVIVVAQVLGEPTPLIDELWSHADYLEDVRVFAGMSLSDVMTHVPPRRSAALLGGHGA